MKGWTAGVVYILLCEFAAVTGDEERALHQVLQREKELSVALEDAKVRSLQSVVLMGDGTGIVGLLPRDGAETEACNASGSQCKNRSGGDKETLGVSK
jgi:hypothetical protein